MEPTKMKVLWMITKRGEKSFWTRVGIGTVNRDGSINLKLDAMPVGGADLQLRDYQPRDAESDQPRDAYDNGKYNAPAMRASEARP